MKTISIIGCGKVGKTLGKLFTIHGVARVVQVLNRSRASAQTAVEFIGSGQVVEDFEELVPADVVLIAASDDAISQCSSKVAASPAVRDGTVVLHCSGSQPSESMAVVRKRGGRIASVHPVKSFADPGLSVESFRGTYCAVEGDGEAIHLVTELFEPVGGILFAVNPEYKLLYHAGTVVVCNYLTALLEVGLRCYEKAGIERSIAMQLMRPIVEGTIVNNYVLGTAHALTGPIARGDDQLVSRQLETIRHWDAGIGGNYAALGLIAVELSEQQGHAQVRHLEAIRATLMAYGSQPSGFAGRDVLGGKTGAGERHET
ncbi:MAG: DUF2520 domain-containing protein [Verrucomicrobia bacterium]|nr:DUF2520 domain-containing protein [Verrucomicrobiota bacterium]